MTAAVETMAYTNEVPWHGLGKYRKNGWKTVKELVKDAGINWQVERREIFDADGNEIPGFAALTRDSDSKVFDIVGSRYVPAQNEQAFTFFKEFVEAGKASLETAGSLKGGRVVWGLAKLNASFKLKGDDQVNGFLLCVCPHEQGKSLLFKTTAIRVVCSNTLAMALGEGGTEWRMGHRTAFDEVKVEEAKTALGIARDQIDQFHKNAEKLQKLKMTNQDFIDVMTPFFGSEVKGADNKRMQQLIDIYERAPGAQPGNGWGALNAVTYYADHVASRTGDKRLTNAWLGKTARQKEAVLVTLLDMTK
jgi:phage/plasmid-like protein (TIGR03299 family)